MIFMRDNNFSHLRIIPLYIQSLIVLSSMPDDKIAFVIKATTAYLLNKPVPETDDALCSMLITELCENIDKAEEKRQKQSAAGKKSTGNHRSDKKEKPVKSEKSEETAITQTNTSGKYQDEIREIMDYLNLRTGKKFSAKSEATKKHIRGRLDEGYGVGDFFIVIDNKVAQWQGTEWEKFLRPQTLFNSEKFDGYLNESNKENTGKTKMQADCEKIAGWLERRNQQ